jgi:hypothetical protein
VDFTADARTPELSNEERDLAHEVERIESELHLLERFTRAKVHLLEEKINAKFDLARFKLFQDQINGGLEETCHTTYQGVPYDSLTHGARLNVGLDIINTLAEHYDFAPPVFVDNAESVTSILPTRGQAIKLVVSSTDPKLRIESTTRQEVPASRSWCSTRHLPPPPRSIPCPCSNASVSGTAKTTPSKPRPRVNLPACFTKSGSSA